MPDVYEILKNLEYRAVGVDPKNPEQLREGFFCAFRTIGLPIRKNDFEGPLRRDGSSEVTKVDGDVKSNLKPDGTAIDGVPPASNPSESLLNTFLVTNDQPKLNPSYQVEPSTAGVSTAWEGIMNGATLNYNPKEFDPEKKKKYDELEAELEKLMPEYDKGQENYDTALDNLFKLFALSKDPEGMQEYMLKGKSAIDKVDFAFTRWGRVKGDVERINAIQNAQGQDPASFYISKSKTNFNKWSVPLPGMPITIPYTKILPSDWFDPTAKGWTKYESSTFKSNTVIRNSKVEAAGGGGFSLGFWSVGANASYNSERKDMQINVDSLDITFEYTTADIKRPWLDTSLLNANNWYLDSEDPVNNPYKKNCISTGVFEQNYQNQNKNICLPTIPTSLVLVKNLKISWKSQNDHISSFNETIKGGGTLGFGIWNLRGSYGRSKEESDALLETNTESISVDGVQLIGYVCEVLPASPFLDSKK